MQKGFLLDLNKCTGCGACCIACKNENETGNGIHWRQIVTFNTGHIPGIPLFHYSLACSHCIDAPCMVNCPALAYDKDEKTGAVIINPDKCMGCKYCLWVCPYDAPKYNEITGVIEKCTFCEELLSEGLEPACVLNCPTGAIQICDFGEKEEPAKLPGFFNFGIEPAVRFIPVREKHKAPEAASMIDLSFLAELAAQFPVNRESKVSVKSEWSLLVFTFFVPVLVAFFFASKISGLRLNPYLFLLAGAAVMGISTIHLGKRFRLLRVILNWKNSWLSRELISFAVFLGISFLYLLTFPESKITGWAASLTGFFTLFTMDKLYLISTNLNFNKIHSAHVFPTGLFLAGVFMLDPVIFMPFALMKIYFYGKRKHENYSSGRPVRPVLAIIRIICGFIIPAFLWFYTENYILFYLSVLTGEFIDRLEFYLELELMRPNTQIEIDLQKMLKDKIKIKSQ